MAKSLVIVESPAKAKTINKYLGRNFSVKASIGHVMDLPKKDIGIVLPPDEDKPAKKKTKKRASAKKKPEVKVKPYNPAKIFEPTYVVIPGKDKVVNDLRKAAATADAIYLAADPDHADELRIDLDPVKGIGFDEVRAAALMVKELLDELGLRSYPKTTGSNGLHVYLRLEPRWDSIVVRAAAVALARELERRHPDEITAKWWKEERGTRVFVDFNQNAPHKTVFGAWFARPRVGGQVSTPLAWDEVETVVPDELTIRNVPKLVARRGDPWADIGAAPQSIEPLLAMALRDKEAGLQDAPWPPQYPKMPDEPPRVAPSRAKKEPKDPEEEKA